MNYSTLLYRYNPTYQWQKLAKEMETHSFDQHNDTHYHYEHNMDTIYREIDKICITQEHEETQGVMRLSERVYARCCECGWIGRQMSQVWPRVSLRRVHLNVDEDNDGSQRSR